MYDAYFGFSQPPFAAVPQIGQYFAAEAIEAARNSLVRCVERGEGAGIVVGASGTGKTLLCQLLAEQFRSSLHVVLLSSGRLSTRRALLQAILYELGQPYRGLDEGELRLALVDYLTVGEGASRGLLLLVDEAHTLPLRLVDEVRMLTNLSHGGQSLVRLVLAGGCALEERLASPKLDSFNQRIAGRCYLQPLGRTETQQYIHARLVAVGGNAERVFSQESCDAVHRATDGVPRLINQVCDHALLLACAAGRKRIAPAEVEEAWADLQQLPAPCGAAESENGNSATSTIEFGSNLDDLPQPSNQPAVASEFSPQAIGASEVSMDSFHVTPSGDSDPAMVPHAESQLQKIEQMLSGAEDDFRPAGSIRPEVELVFEDPAHPFGQRFEEEEVVADRYAPCRRPKTNKPYELVQPGKHAAVRSGALETAGESAPGTVPLYRPTDLETAESDDSDMLIVEDGYDDRAAPDVCPIIPVRRLEYGQLFARLRRG